MTSPHEPGAPNTGDNPNGDGSVERAGVHRAPTGPGRLPDGGDSPPWQRGAARASQASSRPAPEPNEGRTSVPPPDADARLNRFISGRTAPPASSPPPGKSPAQEPEGPGAEAYPSELPDLSGPAPRATQRNPAPERPAAGAAATTGSGSGRSTSSETRETHVQVASRRPRGPVRASMQIRRIDPWSTLKVSLLLSVALFFVWMIAVAFLYLVLGGMGVWTKLNSNVGDLLNNTSGSSGELVSSGTIFGGAILIGLVNIVLLTALATIGAFVYNLTTDLIGGIEVTLADRD
ncbi:DUF3566 domain-containing protein [Mycobacterium spongiae]|uniref:DUF3566 domain-containing protein n=1 Tax=Mycobacterium spongiae TaxID=886343 RepID=A0A975JVX2_9MYCO|nr:DUF3566 domain-containing protein [Mycobacterium spongiae]QUR65678.1 hypothetical protein F6B93_00035 [Mycobacterium spongiae]